MGIMGRAQRAQRSDQRRTERSGRGSGRKEGGMLARIGSRGPQPRRIQKSALVAPPCSTTSFLPPQCIVRESKSTASPAPSKATLLSQSRSIASRLEMVIWPPEPLPPKAAWACAVCVRGRKSVAPIVALIGCSATKQVEIRRRGKGK